MRCPARQVRCYGRSGLEEIWLITYSEDANTRMPFTGENRRNIWRHLPDGTKDIYPLNSFHGS